MYGCQAIASIAINRTDAEASVTFNWGKQRCKWHEIILHLETTLTVAVITLAGTSAAQTSQTIGAHSVINFKDDFTISLKTEILATNEEISLSQTLLGISSLQVLTAHILKLTHSTVQSKPHRASNLNPKSLIPFRSFMPGKMAKPLKMISL